MAVEPQAGPPCYDAWDLDQELQHIQRVLHAHKLSPRRLEKACRQEIARLDPPHAGPTGGHSLPAVQSAPKGAPRPARRRSIPPGSAPPRSTWATLTWTAVALGTTTFVCGGVLLAWSVMSGRAELWTIGMPITLGGQIALLVGLILQLERLWHQSRRASVKLDDMGQDIHELKTTAALLGTIHGSPGAAFYSHLAGGAGPQLLLTDLKGQLDLLAAKIGDEA